MKIEFSNPATRFLALSAIALTLSVAPSRADWTTVRADGSIVTVPSSLKVGDERTPEEANPTAPNADGPDDYASDEGEAIQNTPTYDGPGRAPSERVQRNRERTREQNLNRRNRSRGGEFLQPSDGSNVGHVRSLQPAPNAAFNGNGLNYGGAIRYDQQFGVQYPGYGGSGYGYSTPAYPYGVPYGGAYGGYGGYGGVVAPGATIVVPQGAISVPIAPAPYPWVRPPVFTSIPIGGTTIITGTGANGYPYGTPYGTSYGTPYGYPNNCAPYPPVYPPAYPPQVAYPYGYPQSYSYPNGTVTQSYGGLSISRGGVSVSVGGSTTSTQSTWGTGLYR